MSSDGDRIRFATLFSLLVLAAILVFCAREDRAYKEWKNDARSLFRPYFEIEDSCRRTLSPGARILIDLSDLKKIHAPFRSRVLGPTRKAVYLKLDPESQRYLRRMFPDELDFRVVRLNRSRNLVLDGRIPLAGLRKLRKIDFVATRQFMEAHEIRYYLCTDDIWGRLKTEAEAKGFRVVQVKGRLFLAEPEKSGPDS